MSVQASVVLNTVRTLLNDDNAAIWTDAVLIPKLQQAHRELQNKLKFAAVPIMRAEAILAVATGTLIFASPSDLVEPIRLWEKATADPITGYVLMTESDPLPNVVAASTLIYWQWKDEIITFIGATADRTVKLLYWRNLTLPTVNTDFIGFISGELYLAPRVAALAAGSVGEKDVFAAMTSLASESLNMVILSNRGRGVVTQGSVGRP